MDARSRSRSGATAMSSSRARGDPLLSRFEDEGPFGQAACPHPPAASQWAPPSPRNGRREQGGFTLIEMLVALAIFSLAALALLRLGGATATNSARLGSQAMAQIVARNLAVEVLTDP